MPDILRVLRGSFLSIRCQPACVITLMPRVLLVEDTPDIALWLAAALRQTGLQVEVAPDGLQAHARLMPGHGWDAVLLDLQLPGLDGLSLLRTLCSCNLLAKFSCRCS